MRRARALPIGLASTAIALVGGCAPEPAAISPERAISTEAPQRGTDPAPVLTGVSEGVEVHWWLADDVGGGVGACLEPFIEPPWPPDPALRERWEKSGLRLVRLPRAKFAALQSKLPAVRPRYRQWVGWPSTWIEIFRGRRVGAAPLALAGARFDPPAGISRMLMRCWPVPGTEGDAVTLQLELLFQVQTRGAEASRDPFERPRIDPPEREGENIPAIALRAAIEDGYVYVITAETPGVVWPKSSAPPQQRDGAGFAPPIDDARETAQASEPSDAVGPPLPTALTEEEQPAPRHVSFGEAMMTSTGEKPDAPRHKVVLVVLPRAPEALRLLP